MIGTLGAITVPSAGTPVRIWNGEHKGIHAILFQALGGNTGKVYIGNRGLNKTTLVGCYGVITIPQSGQPLPHWSAAYTPAPNGLDALENFTVDADQNNDGVLVTFIQG